MKTHFLKSLILLICISFTAVSTAKTIDYEKTDIVITDSVHDSVVQISQVTTQNIGDQNDSQGFDLCYEIGSGYSTGVTTSGYSSDISINKTVIRNTIGSKIETSDSKFTQSWRGNTSGMSMQRTGSRSKNIQRNHYDPEGNYYKSKGNDSGYYKPTQFLSKDIFLFRISSSYSLNN